MNRFILDIYHRDINALESPFQTGSNENQAMSQLEDLESKIIKVIPEEYHSLLSDYHNVFMKVVDAVAEEDFLEGYRMGVHLMLAAWPKE